MSRGPCRPAQEPPKVGLLADDPDGPTREDPPRAGRPSRYRDRASVPTVSVRTSSVSPLPGSSRPRRSQKALESTVQVRISDQFDGDMLPVGLPTDRSISLPSSRSIRRSVPLAAGPTASPRCRPGGCPWLGRPASAPTRVCWSRDARISPPTSVTIVVKRPPSTNARMAAPVGPMSGIAGIFARRQRDGSARALAVRRLRSRRTPGSPATICGFESRLPPAAPSSSGRTADFESVNRGSNPRRGSQSTPAAIRELNTWRRGEVAQHGGLQNLYSPVRIRSCRLHTPQPETGPSGRFLITQCCPSLDRRGPCPPSPRHGRACGRRNVG